MADLCPGFHATEIGPLPEEWEVVKMEEVAQIEMGQSPPSSTYNQDGVGLPFLQGKAEFRDVYPAPTKWCSTPLKVAHEGDILISVRAPVGDVNIARSRCCIGRGLAALSFRRADAFFGFYWLRFAKRLLEAEGTGTTFQSINRSVLKKLAFPLPPPSEQRAIAGVLRTVQQAIAATEQVIAAARELKRSLMRHLFTYGPVAVGQAGQVLLQENEFGMLPENWPIARLDECAFVQTGAAKGRRFGDSKTVDVPYLRVANVQDGYLDLSEIKHIRIQESEIPRYSLQHGDVVVTEGGDFDKLGRGFIWQGEIAHCVHQNHIFAIRTRRDILLPEYLAYLVQSDYGKAYFLTVAHRTTHLACINAAKLKAFPAVLPSLPEQREIARLLATVDCKIAAEGARQAALEDLFKTLLHHLMTGRVRVPPVMMKEESS